MRRLWKKVEARNLDKIGGHLERDQQGNSGREVYPQNKRHHLIQGVYGYLGLAAWDHSAPRTLLGVERERHNNLT